MTSRTRTRALAFAFVAAVLLAAAATAVPARGLEGQGYEPAKPSRDGIGKRYLGREIAGVMGWQGAAWLERNEREQEERTDLLVAELHLAAGAQIADIGAGTGYVSRRLAVAVGATGKVFAVDVQPEMIRMLTQLAERDRLPQIVPVLCAIDDVRLAPASIDLALLVDVYHELEYPLEVLGSVVRALKPGGRIVFVEYRAEDGGVPIKALHKMSLAQIKREALVLPLEFERVDEVLPWQHIVVFRKR